MASSEIFRRRELLRIRDEQVRRSRELRSAAAETAVESSQAVSRARALLDVGRQREVLGRRFRPAPGVGKGAPTRECVQADLARERKWDQSA